MNDMTLSSKHKMRNSGHGGLRPSTLPLDHRGSPHIESSRVSGEETICLFETSMPERSPTFQAGNFKAAPRDDIDFRF